MRLRSGKLPFLAAKMNFFTIRAGILKALGSFDPMRIWEAAQEVRSGAADQRLDEPTRLSLGMGCIPAEPHFRFTWRSSL